jgi:ATP-binding cassette subfamily G (WHITE) protein 2 (SNQ2)
MLDVIGAGATAITSTDWHQVWVSSPEASELDFEIERIHMQGRACPLLESGSGIHPEFTTSWMNQFSALTRRGFESYWRSPTYIFAKLILNVTAGLLVGLTFFHSENTLLGTQNKLFVGAL